MSDDELEAELRALADEWERRYEEHTEYGPAGMYALELREVLDE